MPPLRDHQSQGVTKLLFLGDSGAGKTGALAALAGAGYRLLIADFDNGLDVLHNILLDPKSPYSKSAADNVRYATLEDERKVVGGKIVITKAVAWQKLTLMMQRWTDSGELLGGIEDWGPQDVFVLDSFTAANDAAFNFVLAMNGRLGQRPWDSDYGEGQRLVRELLMLLTSPFVKCNVILNCHIKYIGGDMEAPASGDRKPSRVPSSIPLGSMQRGYPNALGKALSPEIGRYFNNALLARSVGQGTAIKRKILTNTSGVVDLKNSAPLRVAAEYPLETGLADYFAAVRGQVAAEQKVVPLKGP